MPNSIVRIGCNAFNYCESLKQIVIPNSVEVIEDGAFANCYSLESVRLPKSIKQLGDSLFNECDELKHIIIPIGTKDIFVKGAFYGLIIDDGANVVIQDFHLNIVEVDLKI